MKLKPQQCLIENGEQPYHGVRGKAFEDMLVRVLKMGKIKQKYIDKLLEEGLSIYEQIFTHPSIDETNNYEFYEIMGDATINKAVVWYISRRFPQLNCPDGVKIIARLKINMVSKENFSKLAEKLGFWEYISATEQYRYSEMKPILEDVFEAFFGATEQILDTHIKYGVGYAICYQILETLFNEIDISLNYNDLYDAKTRLKELFDHIRSRAKIEDAMYHYQYDNRSGVIAYFPNVTQVKYGYSQITSIKMEFEGIRDEDVNIMNVKLYANMELNVQDRTIQKKIYLTSGSGSLKPKGEQMACEKALDMFKQRGIFKPVPPLYETL